METDLGTKLDWIAVDHHNTGHPHTHILVRGVTDNGNTLNIAGEGGGKEEALPGQRQYTALRSAA